MNIEVLIEKRNSHLSYRIVSHFLFWVLSFSSTYFLIKYSFNDYRNSPLAYLTPLRNIFGLILVFYPLMYFVVPRFFKRRKWWFLFYSLVILTFLYVVVEAIGDKLVFQYCDSCIQLALEHNPSYLTVIRKSIVTNILYKGSNIQLFLQLFSGLVLPIAIKMSIGYYHFFIKNLRLEKEKVHLELNFLKAQVNPHFLFNTLNNLYGLVMHERTDMSLIAISRLSEFLRYTLDSAKQKTIQLSEEIKLIENYIELEKLRLNNTEVILDINIDSESVVLPPLLFIPLLENAFKYNDDQTDNKINIELNVKENHISFKVQNKFDTNEKNKSHGGLGLKNLDKRLKLYFQENYQYEVTKEDSTYTVLLNIDL
ncbi:MAG: sensor histidine kinase [Saprospiraceae bacterium]